MEDVSTLESWALEPPPQLSIVAAVMLFLLVLGTTLNSHRTEIRELTQLLREHRADLSTALRPVVITDAAVFPESVKAEVHRAVQSLRNQGRDNAALILRVQWQLEEDLRDLGRRISALSGAVLEIEQLYESICISITDVVELWDRVMSKEESLYMQHTASVAKALSDLSREVRQLSQTQGQPGRNDVAMLAYLSDVFQMLQSHDTIIHSDVIPALRYIADRLAASAEGAMTS